MDGKDFVAVCRLSNKSGETLAEAGGSCDKVPEVSLGWLLASGRIKAAPEVPAPKRRARREKE